MQFTKLAVSVCALMLAPAAAMAAESWDLTPLSSVADESGFGTLYDSLSSNFAAGSGGFSGTVDSRVYVDALPASQVTFVFDVTMSGTVYTPMQDMTIAAGAGQNDLRITEIAGGTNGYVSGTTTNVPDNADAYNNDFPTVDELFYEWVSSTMGSSDRATLFVTTTGAVDVGQVNVAFQDAGGASGLVLAPVDNDSDPDLNVPEPASLLLFGAGACAALRRRRH